MTTTDERVRKQVQAKVLATSSDAKRSNVLKLEIPEFGAVNDRAMEIGFVPAEQFAKANLGETYTVILERGKLKMNPSTKQALPGTRESHYFWNVVGLADKQQAPPTKTPAVQAPSATERPQEVAPPADMLVDPLLGGIGHESDWAGFFYHDVTDAAYNARINWAQAVNLAVAVLEKFDDDGEERASGYLTRVDFWANCFYLLIRKGPSPQRSDIDPETLPWDAQESPQEGPPVASAPRAGPRTPRLPNQPDKPYFFMVANKDYGLMPTAALQKLGQAQPHEGDTEPRGFGNYETWIAEGHTLAEALKKLEK